MSKKILLVDDSTFMRLVLKDILMNNLPNALDVIEADGEKQALSVIKNEKPDLVLLDIIMNSSETEGINILKTIHTKYSNIPVIMITSIGQIAIKEQCNSLGAKGYIQKPFNAEEIKMEVSKYL